MVFRLVPVLLLLLSAARAEVEIEVERDGEALVVRSSITQGNFLFRAPGAFRREKAPEGFPLMLQAKATGGDVRILLRIDDQGVADARQSLADLAPAYARQGLEGADRPQSSGGGARVTATVEGKENGRKLARAVLLLRDGARLYVLFVDRSPPEATLDGLDRVIPGFTILDPKGAPAGPTPVDPEALKAATIRKDFYRLEVFKPAGFAELEVDPNDDPGIVLHLRKQDDQKNLCDVHVRVFLTKTVKESLDERAQARIDDFAKRHTDAKVPKRPRRTSWPASRAAFRLKLVGRTRTGHVATEEWRFVEHENDRTYEFQMTLYGGAERLWRKDLAAFWRKLKIENR